MLQFITTNLFNYIYLKYIINFKGEKGECNLIMNKKYYRYMSFKEFDKVMNNEIIISLSNASIQNNTTSKGLCFLEEETKFYPYDAEPKHIEIFKPLECYRFLSGIVSNDVLVEFLSNKKLNKGKGIYSNPCISDFYGSNISINEYWIERYSKKIMVPIRFCLFKENTDYTEWKPDNIYQEFYCPWFSSPIGTLYDINEYEKILKKG